MIYLVLIPLRGGGKRLIKKIINKYRLGNEYKEIKENIENKGSSGGSSSFKYESAKVIWEIDYNNPNKELLYTMCLYLSLIPIYAIYSRHMDASSVMHEKMYGITCSFMLGVTMGALFNDKNEPDEYMVKYIEEAKGPFTIGMGNQAFTFNNFREFFNMSGITPEIIGFKEIPYEEFNPRINNKFGNFLDNQ